jgi:hypothetical protein
VVWIVQLIELIELRVKGVRGPKSSLLTDYIYFLKIYLDIKISYIIEYN